jgi:transcriptional regulator with XRE-family HTH domain
MLESPEVRRGVGDLHWPEPGSTLDVSSVPYQQDSGAFTGFASTVTWMRSTRASLASPLIQFATALSEISNPLTEFASAVTETANSVTEFATEVSGISKSVTAVASAVREISKEVRETTGAVCEISGEVSAFVSLPASKYASLWIMVTHEEGAGAIEDAETEARRLVALLNRLLRQSGRSMRSVEAELGLGSSVVSKVLSGSIRPQISYVLMIARAIGLSPDEFFHLAYPKKLRTMNPLLQQALEVEGLSGDEGDVLADFDARIEAAVRRALAKP